MAKQKYADIERWLGFGKFVNHRRALYGNSLEERSAQKCSGGGGGGCRSSMAGFLLHKTLKYLHRTERQQKNSGKDFKIKGMQVTQSTV